MAISSSGYADGSSHRHQSFQWPFPKMKFSLVSFFKRTLDTDYSLSWLGRIAGCLQKEWKGCFPGCQAKAVLSLKGIEVVVGICMGTGKIRATLMITQKKESP